MRGTRTLCAALWIAAGLALLPGCASIQLVSKYDEATDTGAHALQRKLDAYFIALPNTTPDQRKFKNQQKFYEEVVVDLDALEVRAAGIYKNALTQQQLQGVRDNLAYLVLLHKACITAPLTPDQKQQVHDNGIDLTLHCSKEHGATQDSRDRGDSELKPVLVKPMRALFNQQLGAVIALELAKKRGEQ